MCVCVFPGSTILHCCVSRVSCCYVSRVSRCCVSSLSRQCMYLWMTMLLRFACRTGFATPTKNRHTAGAVRTDVVFTCAPIGAPEGVARQLVGVLPATAEAVMELLSRQKWEDGEVTDRSPQRDEDGCVNVQKVYYRCGGESRRSFTSPTTFNDFIKFVTALKAETTVALLLWDSRSSTAPSTPEKGEMNCLWIFFGTGSAHLSVCVLGWLHTALQRLDVLVFASDWVSSRVCLLPLALFQLIDACFASPFLTDSRGPRRRCRWSGCC